jgi:hypothetical protein
MQVTLADIGNEKHGRRALYADRPAPSRAALATQSPCARGDTVSDGGPLARIGEGHMWRKRKWALIRGSAPTSPAIWPSAGNRRQSFNFRRLARSTDPAYGCVFRCFACAPLLHPLPGTLVSGFDAASLRGGSIAAFTSGSGAFRSSSFAPGVATFIDSD